MAEFFSDTAYNRLPAEIKKLSREAQTVCIYMRLRKTEAQISQETGFSPEKVAEHAIEIRRILILGGKYDIISDPILLSIDGDGVPIEPAGKDISPEDGLMLKKFMQNLNSALSAFSADEKRLLHLFFQRKMTGKEVAEFLNAFRPADEPAKTEQGVFSHLEKILRRLLAAMEESSPIGRGTLTVKGLKDILFETGVAA